MGEHLGKLLALVLRHRPEVAGVTLDPAGWVDVGELVAGLRRGGRRISADDVRRTVETDGKGRYELVDGRIRAAQGHSVRVDLGLEPLAPPEVLYHGTVERFLPSILAGGLRPGSRQFVHLSPDVPTARAVGRRRGAAVVLVVEAAAAHRDGSTFRRASNGVWLADAVPPSYLRLLDRAAQASALRRYSTSAAIPSKGVSTMTSQPASRQAATISSGSIVPEP